MMDDTDARPPRLVELLETGGEPISLEERDRRLLQHRDFIRDLQNNTLRGFNTPDQAFNYYIADRVDVRCDFFEEEIPKRAIECLSEDNEIAWRGYTRLLGLISEVCDLHNFRHARTALERIDLAFKDALHGVQSNLFCVEHDAKDIKKGEAYQVLMGTACALVHAMHRDKETPTKKEAANRVASLLSRHGVHWPIRDTGHSEKDHGERLYATVMKIQVGRGSKLALKYFGNRVNCPAEDTRYLLELDLRHFGSR